MTLHELIHKTEFDSIVPFLKATDPAAPDRGE